MKFFKVLIILFGLVPGFFSSGGAQDMRSIYKIESLFLYNFTKHIKWETGENTVFTVGVYGNSTAFEEMKVNLGNKMAWGNKINVKQISSPAEVHECQIVFMPKSNSNKISNFISQCDFTNTLLVTEEDFMDQGASISFVLVNSKLSFKINKARLEESGLKVSNSLLSLGISA
jgi:hypothetical protein